MTNVKCIAIDKLEFQVVLESSKSLLTDCNAILVPPSLCLRRPGAFILCHFILGIKLADGLPRPVCHEFL